MGIGLEGIHKGKEVTGGDAKRLCGLFSLIREAPEGRQNQFSAVSIFSSILPVGQREDKGCMS